MLKKIFLFFFIWKVLTIVFAHLSTFIIPLKTPFTAGKFGWGLPYLVWIWGNFDGYHYMEIAQRGYQYLEQAFFPFYPILIRLSHSLLNLHFIISGEIISNLAFFLSLIVIYKLLIIDKKRGLFCLLLLTIIFFPTSYSYGAVYNDSLFLLLSTLTIYFARRKSWALSSISGAFATSARLNGLALAFFILFEYWQQHKKNNQAFSFTKILKSKIFFILLIPLVFLGYLLFVHLNFGDWRMVFTTMKIWGQDKIIFPPQVFWRYFKIIFLYPTFQLTYWVAIVELLFVLFYLYMIIYSYKKIRLSYWIFFVISLLIPSLTGTFAGMPRYGLHLYPLFLSLSLFLKHKRVLVKTIYFIVSLIVFFICIALFTRGYFIA